MLSSGSVMLYPLGLEKIATAFPARRIAARELGFAFDDDYYERVSGPAFLPRLGAGESLFGLVEEAARKALGNGSVEAILVVNGGTGLAHMPPFSTRLQAALGLPSSTYCLDLNIQCTGFVHGSSALLDLAGARGWRRALLVNAESYSRLLGPQDSATQLIFSDGAAATVFSAGAPLRVIKLELGFEGSRAEALAAEENVMKMNGPLLYETVLRTIPAHLRKFSEPYSVNDFSRVLVHQASRRVLDRLAEILAWPAAMLPSNLRELGNLGSASVPAMLEALPRPSDGDRLLISTFGAGFQWASMILEMEAR